MTSTSQSVQHKQTFVERHLDPSDRMSEAVFGLVMVLGITSTASLFLEGTSDPALALMVTAVGCNLAWGIVDGVMYVVNSLFSRSRSGYILHLIRNAPDPNAARAAIGGYLDQKLGDLLQSSEQAEVAGWLYDKVERVSEERLHARLTGDDVAGGIATFGVVFIATLPAVIPLLFISDWLIALRMSNVLTILTLFLVGYNLARYNGGNKWLLGLSFVCLGVILVAITIALGG